MNKLIFTLFLLISTIGFSQDKSIEKISSFPNPFSNSTQITFTSNIDSEVIFTVNNVLGKTVYQEKLKTTIGKNSILFSKGNLTSGIYIYTLQNKNHTTSKRFVIQ